MKTVGGVLKELHYLTRDVKEATDGQCQISKIDERNFGKNIKFVITVMPNSGPYKSGKFDFLFKVSHRYPAISPDIKCLTHVYHPNIDDCGEICLSLLDDWYPNYNCLMHCVHGLLFLLKNPNLEDPLSPYFCPEDASDVNKFHENVRKSLEGGVIDDFIFFERNIIIANECTDIESPTM